ncbi:hypothetical protein ECFRIK1999_5821, partial [Escherichia coli FRIK1999]|jgi:hypothetical protein
MNEL